MISITAVLWGIMGLFTRIISIRRCVARFRVSSNTYLPTVHEAVRACVHVSATRTNAPCRWRLFHRTGFCSPITTAGSTTPDSGPSDIAASSRGLTRI